MNILVDLSDTELLEHSGRITQLKKDIYVPSYPAD